MYGVCMSSHPPINVSDARSRLSSIVARAQTEHEPVYLSRHGRRVAAIIDADDLDRLIELSEDMADIRAAQEAREEMLATQQEPIPWDEVKAELGLV